MEEIFFFFFLAIADICASHGVIAYFDCYVTNVLESDWRALYSAQRHGPYTHLTRPLLVFCVRGATSRESPQTLVALELWKLRTSPMVRSSKSPKKSSLLSAKGQSCPLSIVSCPGVSVFWSSTCCPKTASGVVTVACCHYVVIECNWKF